MYNEKLKKRFINYKKEMGNMSAENTFRNTFSKIEPFETKLGKDIYLFSYYEITDMYKEINATNITTLYNLNNRIKNYVQFCISQMITLNHENNFAKFDKKSLAKYLNHAVISKKIFTREEVEEMCLCPQLDNMSDKFILLGMFEGIGAGILGEFPAIKISDIDFEQKTISLCTGRKLRVTDRLLKLAQEAHKEETYYSPLGREYNYIPSQRLIKDRRVDVSHDEVADSQRMLKRIHKIFSVVPIKDTNLTLEDLEDYSVIFNSGIADLIKRESEKAGVSEIEYIISEEWKQSILERYDRKESKEALLVRYEAYFTNEYEEE